MIKVGRQLSKWRWYWRRDDRRWQAVQNRERRQLIKKAGAPDYKGCLPADNKGQLEIKGRWAATVHIKGERAAAVGSWKLVTVNFKRFRGVNRLPTVYPEAASLTLQKKSLSTIIQLSVLRICSDPYHFVGSKSDSRAFRSWFYSFLPWLSQSKN